MNPRQLTTNPAHAGAAAAVAGMLAAVATGAACIGPMAGIAFGIGGLGWLARTAPLQVPASLLTVALLAAGFQLLYRRRDCPCTTGRRGARVLLWIATGMAAAINAFEYLILPALG